MTALTIVARMRVDVAEVMTGDAAERFVAFEGAVEMIHRGQALWLMSLVAFRAGARAHGLFDLLIDPLLVAVDAARLGGEVRAMTLGFAGVPKFRGDMNRGARGGPLLA